MSDEIIVYQKPTCTTCRQVYAALKESGVDFEAVNYYTDPIPKGKLLDLLRNVDGDDDRSDLQLAQG